MEQVYLTLMALFAGLFLVFCTKTQHKLVMLGICSVVGLGAIVVPVFNSLMTGTGFDTNTNFYLLKQLFHIKIDPFSAYIIFLISIICFLYILHKLLLKDYKSDKFVPEILITALFSFLLATCSDNGMYFYLGVFVSSMALLLLTHISVDSFKIGRQLIIYTCVCFITLAIMLLGAYSQSLDFNNLSNFIINNQQNSSNIFMLIFAGFGIPAVLLGDLTGQAKYLGASRYSEILVVETLFYSLCYYGLFRFMGFGVFPSFEYHCAFLGILLVAAGIKLYNLFKTKDLVQFLSNLKSLHITLSLISILFGFFGYVYNIPFLMILGYSAAFIFFTNAIITGFSLQYNINKMNGIQNIAEEPEFALTKMSGFRKILPVGLLSYAGIPATIGFLGWIACAGALYFGITSSVIQLKIISGILALFILTVFLIQNLKIFLVMKDIYYKNNETIKTPLPKINFVFALMIIIAGLFPNKFGNLIFVPVSFFAGGLKFYDIFNQYLLVLRCLSVYLLIFTGLCVSYLVIRTLVLKYAKSRTKV